MYLILLVIVDAVIFLLLREVNGALALLFLILAIVSIPALVIQRREAAYAIEASPDCESAARGWARLFSNVGLDLTGVALGALIIIAFALVVRSLGSGFHG